MRLISLVIGLAIVALLVNKQLGTDTSTDTADVVTGDETAAPPKVPTTPQGVKQFERDMDTFMQEASKKRQESAEPEE